MPTVMPTNLPASAPPRPVTAQFIPPAPRVTLPPQQYAFTNDVYFGTSSTLDPVPTVPKVPDLPHVPNPECRWNPPPAEHTPGRKGRVAWKYPGNATTKTFVYTPGPRRDISQAELGIDEEGHGSVGVGIQLAALGPQNYVLDINPQMTFFKHVYKRHTAFAIECFHDDVDLKFGSTVPIEVPRRGDMLGNTYLEVTLPDLGIPGGTWVDAIGYALLSRIRFIIDDVVVHDQERLLYDLLDKAFMAHSKKQAIDAMIGRGRTLSTDRTHTVHVPFKFFFCSSHHAARQFLPLASLRPDTRLVLELTLSSLAACVSLPDGVNVPLTKSCKGRVLAEQVFVEQDEQRAAWQRPSRIMIDTAQDIDALNYKYDDTGSHAVKAVSLDLREINLPVKCLVFVAYEENAPNTKKYFDYLNIGSATMYMNSNERFAQRPSHYFSLVQTYAHATRCSPDNVHVYSFALDAGAYQPCGSLNFAVLDRPSLRVEVPDAGAPVKVKAFAMCVNWLAFESRTAEFVFT